MFLLDSDSFSVFPLIDTTSLGVGIIHFNSFVIRNLYLIIRFVLRNVKGVIIMFPKKIFAERLKQLRAERKVSMQKLAEEIGLKNKGTIGQFETEITVPSADTLINLADYFNVSLDYLVGRSDDPIRH